MANSDILLSKSNLFSQSNSFESYTMADPKFEKKILIETPDRSSMIHKTSNFQTLMHLLKCMIGSGILAMPCAFQASGLWLGLGLTLGLGLICLHCMNMLVRSSQALCQSTHNIALDYGDVMELSLLHGPQGFVGLSKYSKYLVNIYILIMQFGACAVYIIFVATNIKQVVEEYDAHEPVDDRIYMAAVSSVLFLLVFIKHLTLLAIFSSLANILLLVALVIILQYIVRCLPDVTSRIAVNSFEYIPLFFGTTLFSFEGIGVVLPLENKMATPRDMGGYFGVLTLGLVIATCTYSAIGFYGYLKFGPSVAGSITLNLPQAYWLYSAVRVIVCLSVLLTFLIQFYVPISILWPVLEKYVKTKFRNFFDGVFRLSCLIFTLILALAIPHLDLLISLMGSLAATSLTLIFPPLIDIFVSKGRHDLTYFTLFKNIFITLFGVLCSISGVVVSLKQLIDRYRNM